MTRVSLFLVAALVACGGKSKQQNLAPLPADKPVEAKQETRPPVAVEPPKPLPPLEVKVDVPPVTVKLVSGGKGKKAPLRYAPPVGTSQQVEVVMSFAQTATVDGQPENQIVPPIVLSGSAAAKAVDTGGKVDYTLAVNAADARDVQGAALPIDKFRVALASLSGLVLSGNLEPNGSTAEMVMRIEKPDALSAGALDLIKITLPQWPVFPKEPVGVGAKWQVTRNLTLKAGPQDDAGIAMTHVTSYEVVAKKDKTWTLKAKTAVTGKDQEYKGGKISKIGGAGTSEITFDETAVFPAQTTNMETNLTASEGDKSMQLAFKIGGSVTSPAAPK